MQKTKFCNFFVFYFCVLFDKTPLFYPILLVSLLLFVALQSFLQEAVMQKKLTLKNILKYLFFFLLMWLTKSTSINNVFYPFGFGTFFSLVWCNQSILILSPLYLLASYLVRFSLMDLYASIGTTLVLLISYGIHLKLKKPIKPAVLLVYAVISQAVKVYLQISTGVAWYISLGELVFGLLFMFACMRLMETTIVKGLNGRLTAIEIICGCAFLTVVSASITPLEIYGFKIIKMFAVFAILFCCVCFDLKTTFLCGSVIALGTVVPTNNAVLVAPIILWTLASICFAYKNKFFPSIALLTTEVLCGYYFEFYYGYDILSFAPCLAGTLIFLCIPHKYIEMFRTYYNSNISKLTMQNLLEQNRNTMKKRLGELERVFAEMDKVFRSMIKGKMAKEELKTLMHNDLCSKLCESCPDKNRCYRTYYDETKQTIKTLIDTSFEKGRVTLIDMPSTLTSRCHKVNQMVFEVNNQINQYKNYASLVGSIDTSKMLIAEQLYGVSKIMGQLSQEMSKTPKFDKSKERQIIDELTYNNIICSDVLLYHENNNAICATLAVRKEDKLKALIPKIVSKVCKTKMCVVEENSSAKAGYEILNMRVSPKFDAVFGTANCTKTTSSSSGDCYSLIRMTGDKILMALCDGMGSGEKAERASNTAISLVENFYKAGFDSDIILSVVNKFLSLGSEDVFSCLDLCVLDLSCGMGDFVKLGAVNGFIKHHDTTEVIECGSLPLGIVSSAEPTITHKMLCGGDMIVLCTDGITDSFASDEALQDFINNTQTLNPQTLADTLLDTAIKNNNNSAPDDMTVIVAKIIECP